MLLEIGPHLKKEPHKSRFISTSKAIHSFFQPQRIRDSFLQKVAFGQQDKAELLFTGLYHGKPHKIQEALLHQGTFTDYSGRTFHCSAYEYAYWAKDTQMCRMLERYMDDSTKAEMLARVNKIERAGLSYTQGGVAYFTPHFDFTPLIRALQFYVNNYDAWHAKRNWDAMTAAWLEVGKAQRDVPAHVAQEHCFRDRLFNSTTRFDEKIPRELIIFKWSSTLRYDSWFPLAAPASGLGFDFALARYQNTVIDLHGRRARDPAISDLAAVIQLNKVRTADLVRSQEHLKPRALSQGMNV